MIVVVAIQAEFSFQVFLDLFNFIGCQGFQKHCCFYIFLAVLSEI